MTPTTDAERILGQIQRGEIAAGPDAARRIAARHQAAYGNTVWGPTTSADLTATQMFCGAGGDPRDADAAWADALTALNEEAAA